MKRLVVTGAVALLLTTVALTVRAEPAGKAEGRRAEKAKAVAEIWFLALTGADAKKAMAVSATPFAWDRKRVVESAEELRKLYQSVADDKGARSFKPDSISIESDKSEVADDCFPVDRIIVLIKIEDEGIAVCVRPGDEYKVIGFSD